MGISEREHHIKVLEQFLHDYQEWGEDIELEKTIKYAISSLKTDLKYDLLYEGEDIYTKEEITNMFNDWYYTKDEVITILTELQSEIEEMDSREHECDFATPWCIDKGVVVEIIQEKISALGGEKDEKK